MSPGIYKHVYTQDVVWDVVAVEEGPDEKHLMVKVVPLLATTYEPLEPTPFIGRLRKVELWKWTSLKQD